MAHPNKNSDTPFASFIKITACNMEVGFNFFIYNCDTYFSLTISLILCSYFWNIGIEAKIVSGHRQLELLTLLGKNICMHILARLTFMKSLFSIFLFDNLNFCNSFFPASITVKIKHYGDLY